MYVQDGVLVMLNSEDAFRAFSALDEKSIAWKAVYHGLQHCTLFCPISSEYTDLLRDKVLSILEGKNIKYKVVV